MPPQPEKIGGSSWVVYEWPPAEESVVTYVLPQATRIPAGIGDTVEGVCARVPPGAHTFLFHLDLTFTAGFPICRQALIEALQARGLRLLNAAVTDISKRTTQRYCQQLGLLSTAAAREGDPEELLIVKTDHNAGAWTEKHLSRSQRRQLGFDDPSPVIRGPLSYRIVPRRKVRPKWWEDPRLVVERYIQNRDDHYYKLYVLLDRFGVADVIVPGRIKKAKNSRRTFSLLTASGGPIETVFQGNDYPENLVSQSLELIRHLQLSFGVLDAMVDQDGNCYIVDVNPTPGPPVPNQEILQEHLRGAARD